MPGHAADVGAAAEAVAMRPLLMVVTIFTLLAALWLALMEALLRHPGFALRCGIAGLMVAQCGATLGILALRGGRVLRVFCLGGATALLVYGAYAFSADLRNPHFEGFVLVIAAALMLQGVLTLIALRPAGA